MLAKQFQLSGEIVARGPMATSDEKREFLEKDVYDALRWAFVGAITWLATEGRPERALGMNMNFVQARAAWLFQMKSFEY